MPAICILLQARYWGSIRSDHAYQDIIRCIYHTADSNVCYKLFTVLKSVLRHHTLLNTVIKLSDNPRHFFPVEQVPK
jgi:hypothetical protein